MDRYYGIMLVGVVLMLGVSCLELVELFNSQGHSGYSAAAVMDITLKLFRFENLTPLTGDPDEWQLVTHETNQKLI